MSVRGPNRSPIILSAIIPGLGQFVQRRWLAGVFYLAVFVACFVYLGNYVEKIISSAFAIADSIRNSGNDVPDISYFRLITPVVLATGIYVVNLIDAFLFYRVSVRKWNEWKHMRLDSEQRGR